MDKMKRLFIRELSLVRVGDNSSGITRYFSFFFLVIIIGILPLLLSACGTEISCNSHINFEEGVHILGNFPLVLPDPACFLFNATAYNQIVEAEGTYTNPICGSNLRNPHIRDIDISGSYLTNFEVIMPSGVAMLTPHCMVEAGIMNNSPLLVNFEITGEVILEEAGRRWTNPDNGISSGLMLISWSNLTVNLSIAGALHPLSEIVEEFTRNMLSDKIDEILVARVNALYTGAENPPSTWTEDVYVDGYVPRSAGTGNDDDVLNPVSWEAKFHGLDASFTGPTNLPCTGNYLKWNDVRVFIPTITLKDGPAEGPLTLNFDIQGATDIGSARLGLLQAKWNTGDTSASSFIYVPQAPGSGTTIPGEATTITNGFWLGCTKKCAVRGNAGKTGPSARDVFLQSRTSQAEIQNNFSLVVGCGTP